MTNSSNRYPFQTKSQIIAAQADDSTVQAHLLCLHGLQTDHEQETKSTVVRNRRGFTSSHAVNGCKLAEVVLGGGEWDSEQTAQARSIVSHYGKQLAKFYREEAVRDNPELAAASAVFFTPQPTK